MRKGCQEPTFFTEPAYTYSDGDDAALLVEAYGFELFPWQKRVLTSWLGRDENDRYTATSCGLSVPRQNGKNALLEARELYGVVTTGEKILHTAHEVRTCKFAFNRLCEFFRRDKNPELADMVSHIRQTNGQEAIVLKNGGMVRFSARSRKSGLGDTIDTLVFDEAQELTDEQVEALLPTLAAAGTNNRQFIYTGTPPAPSCPGDVFYRTRKAARKKTDPSLSWYEWGTSQIGDVFDVDRWYRSNPSLGYRLSEDFCLKEVNSMSDDGFARARLGWWSATTKSQAIPYALWENTFTEAPPQEAGIKCFGVQFSPDGARVALGACLKPKDKAIPPHVELIEVRATSEGDSWLVDFLAKRKNAFSLCVIDGKSGADNLAAKLNDVLPRVAFSVATKRTTATSASMLLSALAEQKITHWKNEGQDVLDQSARVCTKRHIGSDGAWGYAGEGSEAIEAVALAHFAALTTKRDPTKRQLVW